MPTIPEALSLAIQHHQAGRLQAAEQIYRQILVIEPNHFDALHLLGVIAHQLGKHDVAIDFIGQAIVSKGTEAAFHNNLGGVHRALGAIPEAVACFRRALELNPDFAEAHYNLANVLHVHEQRNLDEVVASYRRALELKPDIAEAHNNLGEAYRALGKLPEAVGCYRRALELRLDYADALNNLGLACCEQGRFDEAAARYRQALELKPDFAEAHKNLGLLWLLTGNLEQGWPEYEWRLKCKKPSLHPFQQPLWDGGPLNGRTILLLAEQGLGDTLQFIRYAPLVKERGGRVLVACPAALTRILARSPGIDQLVTPDALPPFDVYAPVLSLPHIFGTVQGTIPANVPCLFADPSLTQHWREELNGQPGFKIGIAWQGNPQYSKDCQRSFPLTQFAPLSHLAGVRLFSLQKGPGTEQLSAIAGQMAVTDLGTQLDEAAGPFMDTAAVMQNLDLVITSDTSIAHLAGGLGVPVWVALQRVPDWRWMLDRGDSPWYPSMRLFRQTEHGDWAEVFERIVSAVRTLIDQQPP